MRRLRSRVTGCPVADERYRDANGVTWVIHATQPTATTPVFWSEQAPGETPHYDPEPSGTIAPARAAVVAAIEAYAKAHAGEVVLKVTAKADGAGWIILLLVALAFADNK